MTTPTSRIALFVLQALPGFEKHNPESGIVAGDLLTNPGPFFDERAARQKTYEGSATQLLRFDLDPETAVLVKRAPFGQKPLEGEEYSGPKSQTFIVDGKPVAPKVAAPKKVRKPGVVVSLPLDLGEGNTSDMADESETDTGAEGDGSAE